MEKGDILVFLAHSRRDRGMPRTARASVGEICYHVTNRGNARQAFDREAVLATFREKVECSLFSACMNLSSKEHLRRHDLEPAFPN